MGSSILRDRRSHRLQGYDYRQPGAYFITLVTQGRECLFGKIVEGEMDRNLVGDCIATVFESLPQRFPLQLGAWVVMPNHLHAILFFGVLDEENEATKEREYKDMTNRNTLQPGSLGAVIQNFKSSTTRHVNALSGRKGKTLWERDYYDHIIRDDDDLERIHQYILSNPQRWQEDEEYHPDVIK